MSKTKTPSGNPDTLHMLVIDQKSGDEYEPLRSVFFFMDRVAYEAALARAKRAEALHPELALTVTAAAHSIADDERHLHEYMDDVESGAYSESSGGNPDAIFFN